MPSDAPVAKGQVDGVLTVGLKLGQGARKDDLRVGATAKFSNLVIEKLVGKQNLTGGEINLVSTRPGCAPAAMGNCSAPPRTSISASRPGQTLDLPPSC